MIEPILQQLDDIAAKSAVKARVPAAEGAPVAEKQPEDDAVSAKERRRNLRSDYSCLQLVAPLHGATLPRQQDFRLTKCRDISPTGIALLMDSPPVTEELVIALGSIPFKFFRASVVRVVQREDLPNAPYAVGCKFIQRIGD